MVKEGLLSLDRIHAFPCNLHLSCVYGVQIGPKIYGQQLSISLAETANGNPPPIKFCLNENQMKFCTNSAPTK